ncbi:MAG TPA: hypothetical protein VN707_02510 [Casimicrobiaceae bacterium]|nr:hypothetical protein [Casimicrobiaceae bacterium]
MLQLGAIAALDFVEHLVDIRCRKFMACRCAHDLQLLSACDAGFRSSRRPQSLPHPLCGGHLPPARRLLNFGEFLVLKKDLKALTHMVSMADYSPLVKRTLRP